LQNKCISLKKFYSPIRGGEKSFDRPPTNCRIAKLFGRRATPIKETATLVNTVVVQPTEKKNYIVKMQNLSESSPLVLNSVVNIIK